jgi:alanyl-tRNA synthetase
MSTVRIYYGDAFAREFTAQVRSCEPASTPSTDSPAHPLWRVKLDRTAFYPTSGGQPHDVGELGGACVVDVVDEGEEVIHVVDRAVEVGPITGSIDWARRFDHMQQHTGQHLLSAVFHSKFALPTVSFHLGADICTIDLRGHEPGPEILESAVSVANEIVYEDRAVNVKYGTAEELAAAGVRKTVERTGVLRAIEIEGLELQPCGGTHVRRTGQIGMIQIRGVSKIRQDWRVEFACGKRAEKFAREDLMILKAVAQRLNCSVAETVVTAERVVAEKDAHFKNARASMEKLAGLDALAAVQATAAGADGVRVVTRVFRGVAPEYVQAFAREVAQSDKTIALVVRAECGHVFFSQHPSAGKEMNVLLAAALKNVGGKGGGSRDAARGRLAEPSRVTEFMNLAAELLRSRS